MVARGEVWKELDKSLTALVQSLEPKLESGTRDLLGDFVKNREYGVAIEWLNSYLDEHSVRLSHQQGEEVLRISKLLGIPHNS
jgi:hypothetical protein